MEKQIEVKNQLTVIVRRRGDSIALKPATSSELVNIIETMSSADDPCKITIFRDQSKIDIEVAGLCNRIEALSALINPDFDASKDDRDTTIGLLSDLAEDMRGLSLT